MNITLWIVAVIVWAAGTLITGKWFHVLDICKDCDDRKICSLPYLSAVFIWPLTIILSIGKKILRGTFRYSKCAAKARRIKAEDPYREHDRCSNCGAILVEDDDLRQKKSA